MAAVKPFFISTKEINLIDSMNEELIDEMVGQSQKLNMNRAINHFKAQGLDLCKILYKPHKNISKDLSLTDLVNKHGCTFCSVAFFQATRDICSVLDERITTGKTRRPLCVSSGHRID